MPSKAQRQSCPPGTAFNACRASTILTEHTETGFSWHHRDFTHSNSFPLLLSCPRGNKREFWVGGVGAGARAGRGGGSSSSWLCLTSSLKPRCIYELGGKKPKILGCAPPPSSAPLQTPFTERRWDGTVPQNSTQDLFQILPVELTYHWPTGNSRVIPKIFMFQSFQQRS